MKLEQYNRTLIKFDLLNKFYYKDVSKIPRIEKIILTFAYDKNVNLKKLAIQMLALEVLTSQQGFLKKNMFSNISLNIKKGNPYKCTITLRKKLMYKTFSTILWHFFPTLKRFKGYNILKKNIKTFSFELKNILNFSVLSNNYQIFSGLYCLQITIVSNSEHFEEFYYILKSYKFPLRTK